MVGRDGRRNLIDNDCHDLSTLLSLDFVRPSRTAAFLDGAREWRIIFVQAERRTGQQWRAMVRIAYILQHVGRAQKRRDTVTRKRSISLGEH